jgi:predicted secreted protein
MTPTRSLLAATLAAACGAAAAQNAVSVPPPQNVLTLSASATVEVPKDLLSVTLSATREGADAATVQAQLKTALDAALAEARKAARPGALDVQTGNFALYPRYAPKGGISGWQGSAELLIEGRDTAAVAALAGRLPTMAVARVAFGLSREGREKVEADVTAQAIAKFRQKADFAAKQFGFAGWSVREIAVSADGGPTPVPMVRASVAMRAGAADESLPVEAGKAAVTATVSGSVTMSAR